MLRYSAHTRNVALLAAAEARYLAGVAFQGRSMEVAGSFLRGGPMRSSNVIDAGVSLVVALLLPFGGHFVACLRTILQTQR